VVLVRRIVVGPFGAQDRLLLQVTGFAKTLPAENTALCNLYSKLKTQLKRKIFFSF